MKRLAIMLLANQKGIEENRRKILEIQEGKWDFLLPNRIFKDRHEWIEHERKDIDRHRKNIERARNELNLSRIGQMPE